MKKKNLLIAGILTSPFYCLAAWAQVPAGAKTAGDVNVSTTETWISFLPAVFFAVILIVTVVKLRNDKTKLSDLLAEKDLPTPPPAGGAGTPPTGGAGTPPTGGAGTPPPPQSVSRFIAFLTALVSLSIGICLCTFFLYRYFANPEKPADLSNLTTVIFGMGIGIIPYGANKFSNALKP